MTLSTRTASWLAALAVGVTLGGRPALAQTVFESVGERALGMGGAFVAVADDATAAHWNPAGLATGGPAGMTIGWHGFQFGNADATPLPGSARRHATFSSLGTWPLGLSFGTFSTTTLVAGPDEGVWAESLHVKQVGVTILQSVLPGLVVGSTLKWVRGDAGFSPVTAPTTKEAWQAAADQRGDTRHAFDLDLGVMASSDLIRVGLTVKNLRSPSFAAIETAANTLPRQVRLGLALLPVSGVTLAMDLDLDTVDLAGGLRRMSAVGGEAALGGRLSVRSGVRWSLVGPRRPVGTLGASVAVRSGLWLDGHFARGRQDEDREFGVALRAGF
jgi:hypothetical protein